ncbi:MAG: adenylate/guanylate cyclase domain-containing protein [Saprospiraceae bacterium]|nr:adenylate/guanylate cyclase domain-containing protein [Saprospiraceae bacterium]
MAQTRRLAAIMFTDIVGYTALMGNDEVKAFQLLQQNREIQKPIVEQFGGTWIKELGDGVMMSFNTISDAIYAAIRIQEVCNQSKSFLLRIGIHFGEVVFEAEDVFGDVVNIASRLQTLATPGGIWISESVHHNIANKQGIVSRYIKQEVLKNVREPVNIYEVLTGDRAAASEASNLIKPTSTLFPEYDCDIYISYRAADNKQTGNGLGSGWVSELNEKLRQELEATLKDKLTIYFGPSPDSNHPASIDQQEIKSMIFIPVISQTYCDTASLPWQTEFLKFKEAASADKLALNIRLPNGNSASRILPVNIHELDSDDLRLLEKELSGDLRSIDFIYRDHGINRPLRPADDNLHLGSGRVLYRNQINKLANAIKEIINGIKSQSKSIDLPDTPLNITSRAQPVKNFITSLPSSIQVQVIDRAKPTVFLAWTSADLKEQREEMAIIIQKAGFNVFPTIDCPSDDELFKQKVAESLDKCSCSLHILSGEYGRRFESDDETSFPQFQFMEAKRKMEADQDFNSFIWIYPASSNLPIKSAQQNFIKYIRNHITRNMMFSNAAGPMQLVDDMRVVMMKKDAEVYDAKDTDIFFIFNQQDEVEAKAITDRISLEYPVELMNIMPDSPDHYREISSQQIPKSKLAVVYFKYAADWALPFIKQIWKEVGGASSPTPLFLVGDDDPKSNLVRNFKAPKVVSSVVPKEQIPSEVKKVYTTVIELK